MDTEIEQGEPANENPSRGELEILLQNLRNEHRRIDAEIKAIIEAGVFDIMKIKRMKKIKLSLKDQIAIMENQLTPDIIA
jgi:hypothetical protein